MGPTPLSVRATGAHPTCPVASPDRELQFGARGPERPLLPETRVQQFLNAPATLAQSLSGGVYRLFNLKVR